MQYLNLILPWFALFLGIIGWFVNAEFNRKHEIFKKKTELRIELLKSFIEISKKLNFQPGKDFTDEILDVQINFLVFGYEDEIKLFNKLITTMKMDEKDLEKIYQELKDLTNLIRSRLRAELGLPNLT